MIVVARTIGRFPTSVDEEALEQRARSLYKALYPIAREQYGEAFDKFSFELDVEIRLGSTRLKATVKALVGALLMYGSIRESVDYLAKDAHSLARRGLDVAPMALQLPDEPAEYVLRGTGVPRKGSPSV